MKKGIFSLISNQTTIISIFLAVSLIGIIGLIFFKDLTNDKPSPYNQLLSLKILSFLTYAILAFFTHKGIRFIKWVMALIILLTGIHATALGIFGIEWRQYFVKPFFIIFGIYFVYSGIVLFRSKRTDKKEHL